MKTNTKISIVAALMALSLAGCNAPQASSSVSSKASETSSDVSSSEQSSVVPSSEQSSEASSSSDASSAPEESSSSVHTHTYGSDWQSDEDGHYRVCAVCGEESEKEAHVPGEWEREVEPTLDTDGLAKTTCTVCGYQLSMVIPALEAYKISITKDGEPYKEVLTDRTGHYALEIPELGPGEHFGGYFDKDAKIVPLSGSIEKDVTLELKISESLYEVAALEDIKAATDAGISEIIVCDDIVIDETLYVSAPLSIASSGNWTIKRDPAFGGDMFVIGENEEGLQSIVDGIESILTIEPGNETSLTIDGNASVIYAGEEPTVEVVGSAFFLAGLSELNIGDGVTIKNNKKTGNERILSYGKDAVSTDEDPTPYLSNPDKAGGAAICNVYSTVNIEGGVISDNAVNTSSEATDGSSTLGGAVYSVGTININGGTFERNKGDYGSFIYSYRVLNITKGVFRDNIASHYGCVYLPDSQLAEGRILAENLEDVVFEGNAANSSGGAVFVALQASLHVEKAVFKENEATNHGGAICCKGVLTVRDSRFVGNVCGSKGGAVYSYYGSKDESTPGRHATFTNDVFESNEGPLGAALALGNDSEQETIGKYVTCEVTSCEFKSNSAVLNAGGSYGHGGAIYSQKASRLTVQGSTFDGNSAEGNGGVIYGNGGSRIVISDECSFTNNSAKNAGAFYINEEGSYLSVSNSVVTGNQASSNGAAFYVYTSSLCEIEDVVISENTAANFGGAFYQSGASTLKLREVTATANSAKQGGFGYITTTGTTLYIYSGSAATNAATDGGDNLWLNTNKVVVYVKGTTTKEYFDFDGEKLFEVKDNKSFTILDIPE